MRSAGRQASIYVKLPVLNWPRFSSDTRQMTTTDEHYNDRDMDDLKKAAELIEKAFVASFAPGR